ncbi:FAD-binding domain-containing protein [Colletotrichum caudatum]|nr:FAD-binding domain-containing protein [Colletotrichum caudatum]
MLYPRPFCLLAALTLAVAVGAAPYNTFDGPGFPACNDVAAVYNATSVDEIQSLVRDAAAAAGQKIRASGKGHMWYDTMSSDDPNTVIVRTEEVKGIPEFDLAAGSVVIEAGVTFLQLAEYLHARGASAGYTLVNWNITLAGCVAMGAHRSSLREASMLRHLVRDDGDDEWLAASTSLGLLGVIVRMKFRIYPDFKVYAQQKTLEEEDVLDGDIYGMIAPYATANFWWWPYKRKFHHRYYDVVPDNTSTQQGFQNTFSEVFFGLWSRPNFREKTTNEPVDERPVHGRNYDVLIGGLYPGQRPLWEVGVQGDTLELAFPVTQANAMLRRVRRLFDDELKKLVVMTSTYRSGINIKFGRPYFDLLGQVTYNASDGADWSKGAIMLDFPTFRPTVGDHTRFNEPFYHNLARVLIDEFPEVLAQAAKNIDPDHVARFKAVRERFDPNGIFRSVVGEAIGVC